MKNTNLDTSKLNYVVYCRKSSENEDKQIQSLETQLREITDHVERNGLNVVEIIQESKSAFKTGREGFEKMVKLISSKKANAIIVVRANRISRNPVDAGRIIELLDEKKLLYIRTPNSTCFTGSSTDKMMIALELIFSKKDSDDKGDMVKEGQRTKALNGYPHGLAALGFLNDKSGDKGNRKWLVDDVRFGLLKIIFKKFLTGLYSGGSMYKYAVEELKLTTVKRKKIGGGPIMPSRINYILKDPIYAGFFYYDGERYELDKSLPRIITEEQHNKIKNMLLDRRTPKTDSYETTYSGKISSPEGDFIGQDVKFQVICDCKHKFSYLNKERCPKC
ncbi:MAG: Resolvase/invertase-type recombinase catalytic protein, partial [Patescibacteria group bacterium]|nr:Resolvase/invertase-type recombinase catalytic protein [Patescibacteria group bacterium]